ncbi:unnamed protein product [Durusdinium trenchii]|uniref:Uncharacterized protein n=1 Tax=Durusdinium trenchii TaxID=1381693 RepID=A0ABP0L9Y3_9DINO
MTYHFKSTLAFSPAELTHRHRNTPYTPCVACRASRAVMARATFGSVLLVVAMATLGWLCSKVCSFELWALFSGISGLLLMWCLAQRPLLCVSFLYLCGCGVLLVRETVLIFTGQVPCGLVTFGDQCTDTQCVKKNYVLFFEAGCAEYACVHTERQEVQSVFTIDPQTLHSFWVLTGLCLSWAAVCLSARSMLRWMARSYGAYAVNEHSLKIARYTAVVLLVPPTYGTCAMSALRVITINREDTWTAESMMDVAELFSACALYAFQRLLVVYVDCLSPSLSLERTLDQGDVDIKNSFKLQRSFQSVMSLGIKQYVVLAFACNLFLVAVKAWDVLQPASCQEALAFIAHRGFPHHSISLAVSEQKLNQSLHTRATSLACEDVWNSSSLMIMTADFFTCSIALYAILQYEHAFNEVLHAVNPFWKFWGVKGLLSVNFLQSTILAAVSWMTSSDAAGFVATLLNYHLLCAESFVLALLNISAYAVQDEEEKTSDAPMEDVPDEIEGTQMTCLKDPEQPDPQAGRSTLW